MNMRFILVAALAAAAGSGDARSQQAADDTTFVLHINQPVDRAMIGASYCVRGARTGDGYCAAEIPGPFLTMLGPQDIAISTKLPHGGRGRALQAVVYCRGYKLALIDIPSLDAETSRRRTIVLEPLGTVPLAGRVVLPEEKDLTELMLVIEYDLHQFAEAYLHRIGGPTGLVGFQAATARLKADGAFTVTIPDFLADPSIALAHGQGYSISRCGRHDLLTA